LISYPPVTPFLPGYARGILPLENPLRSFVVYVITMRGMIGSGLKPTLAYIWALGKKR
jgi:hypothetical protein